MALRLRGNDSERCTTDNTLAVIPAEAELIVRTAPAGTPSTVIPAKAGLTVRTAPAGTPPTVIPAKAGIDTA